MSSTRHVITLAKNPLLDIRFKRLEARFGGMNLSEIIKLAIIKLDEEGLKEDRNLSIAEFSELLNELALTQNSSTNSNLEEVIEDARNSVFSSKK